MENFFREYSDLPDFNSFWYEAPPVNRSAFSRYPNRSVENSGRENVPAGSNGGNMRKRMMEFLRTNRAVAAGETREPRRERGFQHMMNERLRRERQKQSYLALHSMLPYGTKGDKNSIMEMAAKKIEELNGYKEVLKRKNEVLEAMVVGRDQKVVETKIRLRVANPTSGIDSMLEVLKCLKNLGLEPNTIQSKFSTEEFSALLEIKSEMEAAEVEKAVQGTLYEAEKRLVSHFQEGWMQGGKEERSCSFN